jgi:hypothetical protein
MSMACTAGLPRLATGLSPVISGGCGVAETVHCTGSLRQSTVIQATVQPGQAKRKCGQIALVLTFSVSVFLLLLWVVCSWLGIMWVMIMFTYAYQV